MKIHPEFVGCDASKRNLDFFDGGDGLVHRVENNPAPIGAWLDGLPDLPDRHFIFEATGPHDGHLIKALEARNLRFSRVNPSRARDFGRAVGLMAKTDAIDARMLAAMGQCLDPAPTPARDPARDRLAALHKRRDQLVAMRQKEKVRLMEAEPEDHASLQRHIAWLDTEIMEIEKGRDALVRESEDLSRLSRLLRSIPGIGPVGATTLLALMPELGKTSPRGVAALAGLAPFNVDSGQFRGHRAIRGGRRRVRNALYMAAVTAARSQSRFATFANELRARGKPFKLAIIALARKILVTANAILRDGEPFKSENIVAR